MSTTRPKNATIRQSFAVIFAISFVFLSHLIFTRSDIIQKASHLKLGFGGNSGVSLKMVRNRKYIGKRIAHNTRSQPSITGLDVITCSSSKWAVFTTIFPPSHTVWQLSNLSRSGWCTVVVGDLNTPENFSAGPGVMYVSPDIQKRLGFATVRETPWNHFGRKSIGYLIAIAGGAEVIYDTDDDNVLINDTFVDPLHVNFSIVEKRPAVYHLFNPYSAFGGLPGTWPRGFPLEEVAKKGAGFFSFARGFTKPAEAGVIQILADMDPDVDAVYRLTGKLPLRFKTLMDKVIVPLKTLAPYNAQSTLVMKRAFWSLLLPITVAGRVSDIWRSYFYQPIMWNCGLSLIFHRPEVNHIRSPHMLAADFQAELDLYSKADSLTRFISLQKLKSKTVPAQIEEQVIEMYEHGIVELQDVELAQAWIKDLLSLRYSFPDLLSQKDETQFHTKDRMNIKVQVKLDSIITPNIAVPATPTDRKNLILVMGYYRGPEITWHNFEKYVQLPLNADLASVVSIDASGNYVDEFFLQHSNFSFVYSDREWSYQEALHQIAKVEGKKLSPQFMEKQAQVPGNWLGCLEGSDGRQRAGSGICQIVNRYIAYQFLQKQLKFYDNVMIVRSDSLFFCAPNITSPYQDKPFGRFLGINRYGGFNDRMYSLNREGAIAMLRSVVSIIKDEDYTSKLCKKLKCKNINHEKILRGVAIETNMVIETHDKLCSYLACSFNDQTRRQGCFFRQELGCFKYSDEPTIVQRELQSAEDKQS